MGEEDFWVRLEFRICAEFQSSEDRQLRCNWCDGLVAEEYNLLCEEPCIRGRAWCGPNGQEPWKFVLLVAPTVRMREEIIWSTLLPDDRMTGWLQPDIQNKSMIIDPLSCCPR
ncbi:hypothetical protein AAH979_17635 [Plantactinospora sp. ZYX-F-223]|uniref:hypothetical protein n=1 Tax=Plantactinospora sp. ZYX-F-223 TaxID=3144103 RepID=UPI0031FCB4C0